MNLFWPESRKLIFSIIRHKKHCFQGITSVIPGRPIGGNFSSELKGCSLILWPAKGIKNLEKFISPTGAEDNSSTIVQIKPQAPVALNDINGFAFMRPEAVAAKIFKGRKIYFLIVADVAPEKAAPASLKGYKPVIKTFWPHF